jgi:two-component system KDP operon response regulator KdpE
VNLTLPEHPIRVLIVDDEPPLRMALRTSLTASGFSIEETSNGEDAIGALRRCTFDLVLLDINLPGMSGIETCEHIRSFTAGVGILMVTVRDSEDDKVRALDAGADDFITKPFRFRELVARLRAVLRRITVKATPKDGVIRAGNLEVDVGRRLLRKAGAEIHLSPTEFDLLAVLIQHQGAPVTHVKLLRSVWGPEYGNELEYLRSYVKMLRKKIEDDPARPQYIVTEPWLGYRFRDPSDPDAPSVALPDDEV